MSVYVTGDTSGQMYGGPGSVKEQYINSILKQFGDKMKGSAHAFIEKVSDRWSLEKWQESEKPYLWYRAERAIHTTDKAHVYEVWQDVSYGVLALVIDGVVIEASKQNIIHNGNECVVLDREYYGTVKYIWF